MHFHICSLSYTIFINVSVRFWLPAYAESSIDISHLRWWTCVLYRWVVLPVHTCGCHLFRLCLLISHISSVMHWCVHIALFCSAAQYKIPAVKSWSGEQHRRPSLLSRRSGMMLSMSRLYSLPRGSFRYDGVMQKTGPLALLYSDQTWLMPTTLQLWLAKFFG